MGMTRDIVPQMRIGLYIEQVFFGLVTLNILVQSPDSGELVVHQPKIAGCKLGKKVRGEGETSYFSPLPR
jgi:hypothetical protein